ncbi:MAG: PEGA domain-containing protein [Planctomycetes bacterium]|nr:PEGA domain-containing protein [Planctomycetota bacterium]
MMVRWCLSGLAAATAMLACGCVERWIQVRSEPPGATVYLDGREAGTTPARIPFSFYGGHEILLRRTGYRSVAEMVTTRAPWYEYFPIDFFAENLWPGTIADEHRFSYALAPLPEAGPEEEGAAEKARRLRERLAPGSH